jgi:hypothetical protein
MSGRKAKRDRFARREAWRNDGSLDHSRRRISRRGFLALAAFAPGAAHVLAQGSSQDDVILRAMKDELARSLQLKVPGGKSDDTPYFISYTLDDADMFGVTASFGSVTGTSRNRFRAPLVEVRVGSYDFDNTGHVFSGFYTGSRYDTEPIPLDDDYRALRERFWLGTDFAYKAAVESIGRKRAALANAAANGDRLPDFTKGEAVQALSKVERTRIDEAAWTARAVQLSAIFNAHPEVLASSVEFHFNQDTTYFVNSEGTALRFPDDVTWFSARAEGQAADGMLLRVSMATPALALSQLPSESELRSMVSEMAEHIRGLVNAPLGEQFIGPVLFEPEAAAQLLAQLLGDNLHVQRKPVSDPRRPVNLIASEYEGRINSRVLPEFLSVKDDPTQTSWNGRPLAGYYPFDFEGVRPSPVSLIEKGVLKGFLATRQPVKYGPASNGHARFPGGFGTHAAAIGNLFVTAAETAPFADLKSRFMQMCKDRDKPYGMLIRKLDFPFSGSNGELQALQSSSAGSGGSVRPISPPVLAYRVYPDGREELVRGLRFRGVSTRSLRDIQAASAETTVFNFINNGAPLARAGVSVYIAPSSVIAPGLLFDELELAPAQDELEKLPLVPPPPRGNS